MPSTRTFVVGYGSLMHPQSLAATVDLDWIVSIRPCVLNGWQRSWNANCDTNFSIVSIKKTGNREDVVTAALIEVHSDKRVVRALDDRESCYTRVVVPPSDITLNEKSILQENDTVFTYIIDSVIAPSTRQPIPQSYLDIILEGALVLGGTAFARAFMDSTRHFSKRYLLLDRALPVLKKRRVTIDKSAFKVIDDIVHSTTRK
jgi:hypothetical protein